MRIVTIVGAVSLGWSLWSPVGAQHSDGRVACEFKWQEAGQPPNHREFMEGCIASNLNAFRGGSSRTVAQSSPRAERPPEGQANRHADALPDQQWKSGPIQLGCRMDSCSWMRLKSQTMVQNGQNGTLIKLLAEGGESIHSAGSYEVQQPVKWGGTVESYMFCSKTKPATMYPDGDGWRATMLAPGNPDAGPGMLRESYVEYFLVCHDLNFSKQGVSDKDVVSFGYPAAHAGQAGEQIKLGAPTDIIDDYRSITFEDFKLDGKDLAARQDKVRLQGIYKKFGDLDTLQPSGLAVAIAREYGNDGGIPLLVENATRPVRKYLLECGENPSRPLGCPITVLGHAEICTLKNAFISKEQPCLAIEDGK
jgi:hypothetical protein